MNEMTLTFPALPEYVREVRIALEDFLRQTGVNNETALDLIAAVSEACTNAVRYAYADKSGDMEVKFELGTQGVTVTVTDYGCGFDPKNPPRRPLSDTDIHLGVGLQLIRTLVDEMNIQSSSKGTVITLLKKGKWLC